MVDDPTVVDPELVQPLAAGITGCAVLLFAVMAELLHRARCRHVAALAFGPGERPAPWVRATPTLRVLALAGLAWSLVTLMLVPPKVHATKTLPDSEYRHILIVLDVSPSMRLKDAGPSGEQSRMGRASDVMESFFARVAVEQYRLSVVAFYNGAKPVVIDTTDIEVVRNILNDLPMHYAFRSGKTDIFSGLREAAKVAYPWQPKTTTVLLVTDGDTVSARGMPEMPASVSHVIVVGVGDQVTGKFINGRRSRQDASTLRQIAMRLGGTYHDGNKKHLSSKLLETLDLGRIEGSLDELTLREYAMIVGGLSGAVLAFLSLFLHLFGTRWQPGAAARPIPLQRAS